MATEQSMVTRAARRRRDAPTVPGVGGRSTRAALGRTPRRVRVPELAAGLVIIAVCVLVALLWSRSLTTMSTVTVARRDLSRGDVISADDLVVAEIRGGDSLGLVSGDRMGDLIGRVALVDLAANAPIVAAMLGEMAPMSPDEALVGVALDIGHAPVDLAVGDTVRVVVVNDPTGLNARPPRLLPGTALVRALDPGDEFEPRAVVTLGLPMDAAADVAAAADVRLVRVES